MSKFRMFGEESDFNRWLREIGWRQHCKMSVHDLDCNVMMLHNPLWPIEENIIVETKTYGKQLDDSDPSQKAQIDTLQILDAFLRGLDYGETSDKPRCIVTWSKFKNCLIRARHWGVHYCRLAGTDPNNSEWITWNDKPVTPEFLDKILTLQVDPFTFREVVVTDEDVESWRALASEQASASHVA